MTMERNANEENEFRVRMQTMSQLIEEIGSWSQNNFQDKQAPALGMIEEIGELCHGILKRTQGIRGFDEPVKFVNHIYDAFGDVMIYACNLAYNHGAFFCFSRNVQSPAVDLSRPDYFILSHLLQSVAAICNQETREIADRNAEITIYNAMLQRFCTTMEVWAAQYSINLEDATRHTWNNIVLKRNWKTDAEAGGGHKHDA